MMFADPAITAFCLVVAALLGLVVGSFVNCWAWRYLHDESILHGRSHCVTCGHDLAPRDLVPVASWLALGGTCRYCGEKVSARYPVTEIIGAVVFVAITAAYGISFETLELLAFSGILLFLSLTDYDSYLIPNGCIVAALFVRAVYLAVACALGWLSPERIGYYVFSAFVIGVALVVVVLVADKVFKRDSMGGGDLKLYFVAGLYFGWQQGLLLVILSCVFGIVVGVLAPARDGSDGSDGSESALRRSIPFGPSIAAACVVVMLVGNPLVNGYLSLLG